MGVVLLEKFVFWIGFLLLDLTLEMNSCVPCDQAVNCIQQMYWLLRSILWMTGFAKP